jgi:hypothetical protein
VTQYDNSEAEVPRVSSWPSHNGRVVMMWRLHFCVGVSVSAYYLMIMLYSHRYLIKLCTCLLFNYLFQNLVFSSCHEELEMDTRICRFQYLNENA